MNITTITPNQLEEERLAGREFELLDVRTPVEFREVHVTFARNVPLDQLDARRLTEDPAIAGKTIYVICRSGSRGKQACEKLAAAGVPNVVNVEGGTMAWEQAELPVVRGEKAISLERQVRIAAGILIVIGSAIGAFVSPYGIALAAFVGAGLVFAGITDTCGMALLLAKMPWNQVRESGDSAACSVPSRGVFCVRPSTNK